MRPGEDPDMEKHANFSTTKKGKLINFLALFVYKAQNQEIR